MLGITLGLVITWVLWPVQFTNADAVDLRQSHKDDYVRMISGAYQVDGDLVSAQERLRKIGIANPARTISDIITREKGTPANTGNLNALTHLAQVLSAQPGEVAAQRTPSGGDPQAVEVTATPAESVPRFELVKHTQLSCLDEPEAPHLRFSVLDANGHDLPNIGIQVHWDGGDDTVFTGLKPERGIGYADYEATPGTFSVTVLSGQSDTVSDLLIGEAPANCRADRGATPRGWKLVFQQK